MAAPHTHTLAVHHKTHSILLSLNLEKCLVVVEDITVRTLLQVGRVGGKRSFSSPPFSSPSPSCCCPLELSKINDHRWKEKALQSQLAALHHVIYMAPDKSSHNNTTPTHTCPSIQFRRASHRKLSINST